MSSRPAIIRRAVDFPQPDGPTKTTNSPSGISRFILSTAITSSPKTLVTSSRVTSAIHFLLPSTRTHHSPPPLDGFDSGIGDSPPPRGARHGEIVGDDHAVEAEIAAQHAYGVLRE